MYFQHLRWTRLLSAPDPPLFSPESNVKKERPRNRRIAGEWAPSRQGIISISWFDIIIILLTSSTIFFVEYFSKPIYAVIVDFNLSPLHLFLYVILPLDKSYAERSTMTESPTTMRTKFFLILIHKNLFLSKKNSKLMIFG